MLAAFTATLQRLLKHSETLDKLTLPKIDFWKTPVLHKLAIFHCLTVFTCEALDDVIKCNIVKFGNSKISRTETTFKSG